MMLKGLEPPASEIEVADLEDEVATLALDVYLGDVQCDRWTPQQYCSQSDMPDAPDLGAFDRQNSLPASR